VSVRAHCLLAGAAVVSLAAGGLTLAAAQVSSSGTGLRYGPPDRAALNYVSRCLAATPPRPIELYARGGWYITDDLREQLREREGDIEGIAMVWKVKDRPRVLYQWNHDGEFNRDVVACLDVSGKVIRSESKYTPGDSEPKQRWIYIHTLATAGHQQNLQGSGRFTDRQGHPMGRPHLTPEDQDFIAGERVYRTWNDFDFAGLVGKQGQ
jgi:hypothetical protein